MLAGGPAKGCAGLLLGWDAGADAGLVGRGRGAADCDGQSSGRHPRTAGIGALSEAESGLPFDR